MKMEEFEKRMKAVGVNPALVKEEYLKQGRHIFEELVSAHTHASNVVFNAFRWEGSARGEKFWEAVWNILADTNDGRIEKEKKDDLRN